MKEDKTIYDSHGSNLERVAQNCTGKVTSGQGPMDLGDFDWAIDILRDGRGIDLDPVAFEMVAIL
jgi:hypothetical protein